MVGCAQNECNLNRWSSCRFALCAHLYHCNLYFLLGMQRKQVLSNWLPLDAHLNSFSSSHNRRYKRGKKSVGSVKPFICSKHGKISNQMGNLSIHEIIEEHKNEEPLRFSTSSSMKRHAFDPTAWRDVWKNPNRWKYLQLLQVQQNYPAVGKL